MIKSSIFIVITSHGEVRSSRFFGSAITNLGSSKIMITTSKIFTASRIHGAGVMSATLVLDGFGMLGKVFDILFFFIIEKDFVVRVIIVYYYFVVFIIFYKF
jgi:hypothetical protein